MTDRQRQLAKQRMRALRYRIWDILGLALIVWGAVRIGMAWDSLPDILPRAYGYSAIEGKERLWVTVGLAVLIYVLLTAAEYFPQIWNLPFQPQSEQEDAIYETLHRLLHAEKFTAVLVLLPPVSLPTQVALASVLLPFAVAAYYIRKIYRIKNEKEGQ